MTAAGPVHPLHLGDVSVKRANVVGRGTPMLGETCVSGSGVMLMDLPNWREVYDAAQRRLADAAR